MAKMHGWEKKPRWLEEREREGRRSIHMAFHQRVQPQNLEGMVSLGSSYSQPQHPTMMASSRAGAGASTTSTPSFPAPQQIPQFPRPRIRVPKLAYLAIGGVAAVAFIAYAAGWAAGAFPPSRTADNRVVNPPPVSTPVPPLSTPTVVPTVTPMPGLENILSDQQILAFAKELAQVYPMPLSQDLLDKVVAVNNSLYFKFTGKTMESVKFVPKLLTSEEYAAAGTILNSVGSVTGGPSGELFLCVNKDANTVKYGGPLDVLRILARETGNAEVSRVQGSGTKPIKSPGSIYNAFAQKVAEKYGLGDITDLEVGGIEGESLQTLYQDAVFTYLEERGVVMPSASATTGKERNTVIDSTVDAILANVNSKDNKNFAFYYQASVVDWYRALKHPDTLESLQKTGKTSSQQTISMFNDYNQRVQTLEGFEQVIVEIITAVRTAQNDPSFAQQIKDFAKLRTVSPAEYAYFP